MMPSGGVSLDNMHEWVKNGAWAVGIGSALTKELKTAGFESVTETAEQFVNKYKELA